VHQTILSWAQIVACCNAALTAAFKHTGQRCCCCCCCYVCDYSFFNKKIGYMPQLDESLPSIRPSFEAAVAEAAAAGASGLDVELAASGFNKNHAKDLQAFLDGSEVQDDVEGEEGSDSEDGSEDDDEDGSEDGSSGSGAGEEVAAEAEAADGLADRLAAAATCSANGRATNSSSSRQQRSSKASSSTHRWLEQHAAGAVGADAVAAAAEAAADASSSDADGAPDSDSEQQLSDDEVGDLEDAQAAGAAAAAARAARAAARQQQGGADGEGSIAPSRAPTDISFMVSCVRISFCIAVVVPCIGLLLARDSDRASCCLVVCAAAAAAVRVCQGFTQLQLKV
jgi:hypothetical protein